MKLKKFMALALAGVITASLALTGCGGGSNSSSAASSGTDSSSTASTSGDMKIEMVAKGFQHDFWKAVRTGAENKAKELGATINFVGPDSESAVAQQVEQLKNALNKKPAAICFAALDTSAALDIIANAQSQNIPIIGFDSGVPDAPEGSVKANAATDNYKAGELVATSSYDQVKPVLKEGARIGVVAQDATSQSIGDRTKGYIDKMVELIEKDMGAGSVTVTGHDKYSNGVSGGKVTIDVGIPSDTQDASGDTTANTLLNKSDLVAIYGSNEFSAKCIIRADATLNKLGTGEGKVIGMGFDSGKLQLDAIKEGKFIGAVTQDPVSIGAKAVELAVKAANGEAVSDVDTGALWYTKDNMEDAKIKPCLYE